MIIRNNQLADNHVISGMLIIARKSVQRKITRELNP